MRIKAAVLHEYKKPFAIEEIDLAEPGFGQAQIKIAACGICHTDVLVSDGYKTPLPAVLGHEGAGIVVKVGPDVRSLRPGDPVILTFPSCGQCPNCLSGQPNICDHNSELFFGGRQADGNTPLSQNGNPVSLFFGQSSFAAYATVDVRVLVKVDPAADLRRLAPLGCGVLTGAGAVINTLNPKPGSSIAVFGAGAVGLSAVMAAKACGCTKIIVADKMASRLSKAFEFGATHGIHSEKTVDLADEIAKIDSRGLDFSFDTTGSIDCLKAALQVLHKGGKGAGVAVTGAVSLDSWSALFVSKTWHHVTEGDAMPQVFIPRLMNMHEHGLFPFDKMITFFDFKDINQAFAAVRDGSVVKAVVLMPDNDGDQ